MTIFYALFALFVLLVVFGVIYKIKGLRVALFATGTVLAGFAVLYFGLIYLIVNSMD